MRSDRNRTTAPDRRHAPRLATRLRPVAIGLLWLAAALVPCRPGVAQEATEDELILPETISEADILMRGRYARQWKLSDGTPVVIFLGGFELTMGQRKLSATNAVVWINPQRAEETGRKYYELTVYLSEDAVVQEAGGTVTEDQVLLVRNLRTYGRIVKQQDGHAVENMEASPLYQQALRDRALIERGAVAATQPTTPAIARPEEVERPKAERPPRVVRYRAAKVEPAQTPDGQRVFVLTGGVYLAQEGGRDSPSTEIRAESAVIFPGERAGAGLMGSETVGAPGDEAAPAAQTQPAVPEKRAEEREGGLGFEGRGIEQQIRAAYLEGDVVLSSGNRFVRAPRIYYDFEHSRALLLDAVFRADIPDRRVPLYVRADEIRQLSGREFSARQAKITTSEFHTPSYHVGAERIDLRDTTQRDAAGRAAGAIAGTYEMWNPTLNIGGVPVLWWPHTQGTFEGSETALKSFAAGYSSNFGATVETRWDLLTLLGVQRPSGVDTTLHLDYFSERGPGVGVDANYQTEKNFGLFRSYYIYDTGEDNLGPLRQSENDPPNPNRGRVLWRHREYLPDNWEAQLEISYISDPNFLETYDKSEFQEGKEQETLIYLKRAQGVEALTLLANWRILNFETQTEHLPDLTYRRIGDTFLDPLILYHESRIGDVRYRVDDREYYTYQHYDNSGSTDVTVRADARQEGELPLKLGPLNVVPFSTVRGTYWDGQPLDEGHLWRGLGVYGARGSISFYRVYDEIESELLDIHRIRHIIKPDFAFWWAHSTTRSQLITPFDFDIETIDGFYGGMIGLRQTWQTKRGAAGHQRTVDLLTLDLELGFFGDLQGRDNPADGYANPLRPEDNWTRNYISADLRYRLSDTTSFLYDFNFDLNDRTFDRNDVSLAVERDPRLAYIFGTRYAHDIHMSLVGGGWNYKLNEKHISTVRCYWDVDNGEVGEVAFAYVRKLPRWYLALNLEYDNVDDEYSVSVSLWPEGVPEWTLGSKRFTGLGTSTGINP